MISMERMEPRVPEQEYPQFCCDGAGQASLHDPWCDNAPAEWQEAWANSQHLGHVDFSVIGGTYYCDDERCCGGDDDDDL
jgi:hypothetical protein